MRYACNLLAMMTTFPLHGPGQAASVRELNVHQDSAEAPLQIAAPFPSETAFQMIGRADHTESSITAYGFLSAIAGLDQSMVFTDVGSASAATARFTYYARLERSMVTGLGNIPVTNAEGTLTVYFTEDGGADMEDADSFFHGTPIATTQVQVQEVLQLDQESGGVMTGEGTLTQLHDTPLQLDGNGYRFGHVGLEERLLYSGTTMSGALTPTDLMFSLAGHVTVTSREVRDIPLIGTPAAEASTTGQNSAADNSCDGVESWLDEARASIEQAESIIGRIPEGAELAALDPTSISEATNELGALVEAQRTADPPPIGASANGFLVAAFSTYTQGTTLIERAIEEQDGSLLSQALAIVQDGNELIGRATDQLAEIAATCGIDL